MLETSTEMGLALLWGGLVLPEFGGVTIVDENLRTIHRSRNQTAQGRQRSGLPEPDAGLRTELWFGCEIFSTQHSHADVQAGFHHSLECQYPRTGGGP
jgi:hypothetical protein